ncbi:MAG: radical SAM protein [Acidobacteria bacterium]|nr:radical SAM protein [Acidobacteriota bacterium]
MKLVLVAIHTDNSPRALPLGPAVLASVLKGSHPTEVESRILDFYLGQNAEACADRILESNPDAVGFSMYVWNRIFSLEIAAVLKARRPQLLVFAGGPEATADVQGVRAEAPIDFVLPGEGELIIVEAVDRLLMGATPAELNAWAIPTPVKDISTLPSPFLDGTLDLANYTGVLWELSRGCPFTCDFCFEARGPAGTRRIPIERAAAELECFQASGIREVFVLDPTFNYHKPQAKAVLRLIAEKAPRLLFFFEIRSEFLDQEMAKLFAALPCTLQIGLQSAHDKVLRNISRTFNPKDFKAKIMLLHQMGVPYGFDLIYGLPGDSLQGFRESIDFAMSMVPNHLDIFRLSVLPGTRLADTAPGLKLNYDPKNPYSVISSPTFSADDMAQAERIAGACDVLYNHGKAVPWFDLVLTALDMTPAEVFERFAETLEGASTDDLTRLQRDFVRGLFHEREDTLMGNLAADLITYFGTMAELLDAPDSGATAFRKVAFHHDPDALIAQLQAGHADLEELVFAVPMKPCEVVLRRMGDEVRLELLPA